MKLVIFHLGYFMALVCLSFFTYFFLFGMAFGGAINLFILVVPLVFSVSWIVDYIWRFLSMKPDTEKIRLIPPC
ncbi:hypothetical protein [Gracilibacillus phocaeensis]|uniref:hypothetical protein n=1 Tax=Gracilibacillus phocaeensis TaxID=2042304 RepID=UPI001030A263|nr:hypothetical protein [Gracilibacillus phocaeensis]